MKSNWFSFTFLSFFTSTPRALKHKLRVELLEGNLTDAVLFIFTHLGKIVCASLPQIAASSLWALIPYFNNGEHFSMLFFHDNKARANMVILRISLHFFILFVSYFLQKYLINYVKFASIFDFRKFHKRSVELKCELVQESWVSFTHTGLSRCFSLFFFFS